MQSIIKTPHTLLFVLTATTSSIGRCLGQLQAGVYDFGQGRYGEKRGSWTPGEWLAGILLLMTIVLGLALSVGLCYYVTKRQGERERKERAAAAANYRRQQNLEFSSIRSGGGGGGVKSGQQVLASRPVSTQAPVKTDSYTIDNYRRQQQQQQLHRTTPNDSLIVQI